MTTEKTITGLNLEKGSKNRVAVSLDGLEGFSLSLTAAAGLRKGQILSAKDMERLKKEDARQEAYNQAVRYLALRTRSRKETESYLVGKGCERRIIEDTLERLVEHKYLDDRALARLWVENRDRFKPRSVYALRYELKKKGIEDDLIDGVLADFDEEASAWSLVQGKLRSWQNLEEGYLKKKIMGLLSRRGFTFETASAVYDRAVKNRSHAPS